METLSIRRVKFALLAKTETYEVVDIAVKVTDTVLPAEENAGEATLAEPADVPIVNLPLDPLTRSPVRTYVCPEIVEIVVYARKLVAPPVVPSKYPAALVSVAVPSNVHPLVSVSNVPFVTRLSK